MIKLTVKNTSGGLHGHQLKDLLGGITIAKVFGFNYVHTPYDYLEFFGVGYKENQVSKKDRFLTKKVKVRGPKWDGLSFEEAKELFEPIKQKNRNCLIVIENALRIHPCQTISWYERGLIDANICEEMILSMSSKFAQKHQGRPTYYDKDKINIAMHINRGQDYDPIRFPKHFTDSANPRYIFPLSYYKNIYNQVVEALNEKPHVLHIYTEKLNSEEIVEEFGSDPNVKLHIGANRMDKQHELIYDIFYHFVKSDILISCNSSFSAMPAYFRHNKPTIYHPHKHLFDLRAKNYFATDIEGNIDKVTLKQIVGNK